MTNPLVCKAYLGFCECCGVLSDVACGLLRILPVLNGILRIMCVKWHFGFYGTAYHVEQNLLSCYCDFDFALLEAWWYCFGASKSNNFYKTPVQAAVFSVKGGIQMGWLCCRNSLCWCVSATLALSVATFLLCFIKRGLVPYWMGCSFLRK